MPIDNATNRARVKASREALIARIGKDEYLRQENEKRKARRTRQRARTAVPAPVAVPFTPPTVAIERSVPINVPFTPPTVKLEKTVPINIPTLEQKDQKEEKEQKEPDTCEQLFEKVYQAKIKYYANLSIPRKIKRDSVLQQFKKIVNLHRKIFGTLTDCNNLNFLKDTDKVISFVNKQYKTPNSRNSQIQAISSILQVLPQYKDEYTFYSKFSTKERQKINKEAEKNLTTAKEIPNILAWDGLKDLYKNEKMSPEHRALIGLYTLIPPRRIQDMQLLTMTDTEVNDNPNLNYLVVKRGIPTRLIFNEFKTKQTYGIQSFDIAKDLADALQPYIKDKKPGDPVFNTKNNKHIKNFSEYLTSVFKKYTGKALTVNLIRHAFVSAFLKKNTSVADRKAISNKMAHSVAVQGLYNRIDLE